jgi:hypothetical protein
MCTWCSRSAAASSAHERGTAHARAAGRAGAYLVNEEHTRHELGDACVDVAIDNLGTNTVDGGEQAAPMSDVEGPAGDAASRLVDLLPQFVRYLRLFGLHHLSHDRHQVLAALRPCIGGVQVVQRHVLRHESTRPSRERSRECCFCLLQVQQVWVSE